MHKLLEMPLGGASGWKVVMKHCQQTLTFQNKLDSSPLTLADKAANRVIADRLVGSGLLLVSKEAQDLHLAAERF